jgi:hypothetical protein
MAVFQFEKGMFKTGNFHLATDPVALIVDSVSVLMGEYEMHRKMAANMILKIFLNDEFRKFLFEDASLYPIKRTDSRVMAWRKQILSKGYCEKCGSKEILEAHHVLYWSDYPMGRFDTNNGICLCQYCHADEHVGESVHDLMVSKFR